MSAVSYIVKNILFLGPLLAGPLIAQRSDTRYNTGQYIYLIYTFVIGIFLIFSILKQVYSPGQRAVAKEQLKRIAKITVSEEEDFGGGNDFFVFRGLRNLFLFPGNVLDFLFFPKDRNNYILSFIFLFVFSVIAYFYSITENKTGEANTVINSLFLIPLITVLIYLSISFFKFGESFDNLKNSFGV